MEKENKDKKTNTMNEECVYKEFYCMIGRLVVVGKFALEGETSKKERTPQKQTPSKKTYQIGRNQYKTILLGTPLSRYWQHHLSKQPAVVSEEFLWGHRYSSDLQGDSI